MQKLLDDIELDVQELKYLLQTIATDANPALRVVTKRNIRQLKARLDKLLELLDSSDTVCPSDTVTPLPIRDASEASETSLPKNEHLVIVEKPATKPLGEEQETPILAERIKPAAELRRAISLNDSFRFARELFDGDADRMNDVIRRLGEASSLDEAMELLASETDLNKESEAVADFVDLLKKYFS